MSQSVETNGPMPAESPEPTPNHSPSAAPGEPAPMTDSARLRELTAIENGEISPLRARAEADSDDELAPPPPEAEFESEDDSDDDVRPASVRERAVAATDEVGDAAGDAISDDEGDVLADDSASDSDDALGSDSGSDSGDALGDNLGDEAGTEIPAELLDGTGPSPTAGEPVDTDLEGLRPPLPEELPRVLEALLFVSAKPLSADKLRTVLNMDSIVPIRQAMDFLKAEYERGGHAFQVAMRAGGYVLQTRSHYDEFISRLRRVRREQRMSQGALITLAIIAYRQPITRVEIDNIRGANSSHYIRALMERGLVRVVGRKQAPGHPTLYGTTAAFLEQFGMHNLRDLPQEADFGDGGNDPLGNRQSLGGETETDGDPNPDANSDEGDAPDLAAPEIDGNGHATAHSRASLDAESDAPADDATTDPTDDDAD